MPDRCPDCSFDPTALSDYCERHRSPTDRLDPHALREAREAWDRQHGLGAARDYIKLLEAYVDRQGCMCSCCDHAEGSDCACNCHATGRCSAEAPPETSLHSGRAEVQRLRDENAELRDTLDTARRQVSDNMALAMVEGDRHLLRQEVQRLTAENERLRADL